jgi:hypothetical protein
MIFGHNSTTLLAFVVGYVFFNASSTCSSWEANNNLNEVMTIISGLASNHIMLYLTFPIVIHLSVGSFGMSHPLI